MPVLGRFLTFVVYLMQRSWRGLLREVPDFRVYLHSIQAGGMSKRLERADLSFSARLFVSSNQVVSVRVHGFS